MKTLPAFFGPELSDFYINAEGRIATRCTDCDEGTCESLYGLPHGEIGCEWSKCSTCDGTGEYDSGYDAPKDATDAVALYLLIREEEIRRCFRFLVVQRGAALAALYADEKYKRISTISDALEERAMRRAAHRVEQHNAPLGS